MATRLGTITLLIPGVIILLKYYFNREEIREWGYETWDLTKKIFPVLKVGTFTVGVIAYYLPPETFMAFLGGNSLASCFTASIIGALLYMPTLLEVPIVVSTTFGYSAAQNEYAEALMNEYKKYSKEDNKMAECCTDGTILLIKITAEQLSQMPEMAVKASRVAI